MDAVEDRREGDMLGDWGWSIFVLVVEAIVYVYEEADRGLQESLRRQLYMIQEIRKGIEQDLRIE